MHAPEAEQFGVRFQQEHDAVTTTVQADAKALRQAICNVLENAIRFSPRDESVRIRIFRQAGQIGLSIGDKGPGIPEELLARIVRPFELVRVDAYSAKNGAGLGLPLARMLVELHDGSLEISSEEGHGTTVTLLLPA